MNRIRMLAFALMVAIGAQKVGLLLCCILTDQHCGVYAKKLVSQKNFEKPMQVNQIAQTSCWGKIYNADASGLSLGEDFRGFITSKGKANFCTGTVQPLFDITVTERCTEDVKLVHSGSQPSSAYKGVTGETRCLVSIRSVNNLTKLLLTPHLLINI